MCVRKPRPQEEQKAAHVFQEAVGSHPEETGESPWLEVLLGLCMNDVTGTHPGGCNDEIPVVSVQGYSAEAWETIRKETKAHLLRAQRLLSPLISSKWSLSQMLKQDVKKSITAINILLYVFIYSAFIK